MFCWAVHLAECRTGTCGFFHGGTFRLCKGKKPKNLRYQNSDIFRIFMQELRWIRQKIPFHPKLNFHWFLLYFLSNPHKVKEECPPLGLIEKPAGNNKHWAGPGSQHASSQHQLPATKFVQTFCQVFNRIGCPVPAQPQLAGCCCLTTCSCIKMQLSTQPGTFHQDHQLKGGCNSKLAFS